MIKIKQIPDQKTWDRFVIQRKSVSFFHSFGWGRFCQSLGERVNRLGFYEHNHLVGVALITQVLAKRGRFLFCPHGPLFTRDQEKYWRFFLKFIKQQGREAKVDFVRISPTLQADSPLKKIFTKEGFINAPIHMSAESWWILPLGGESPDEILLKMRKTTRYEIKKAQKAGYQVIKSQSLKDLEIFLSLYHQTVKRTDFVPFSDEYLKWEFATFVNNDQAMLFLEKHKSVVVAALMVIFYGNGAFYHQGASLPHHRESVSYLAQWEAILEAKKRGGSFYNFWGIAPTDQKDHPWHGLTLFKKGFGGYQLDLMHAQDFPLNKIKYPLIYLFETIRKIKRRL